MELADLIGQKLVLGIPGTSLTPEIIQHFRDLRAGGLILYRRNFVSPSQVRALITVLEEALGRRLLVLVDHEGGRVIMFGAGVTVFPDNLAVGTAGQVAYARQQGEIEARELRRLGVDVNLAPVLDVLTEAYSPNIGIRSYGQDPQKVAALGCARLAAMQAGGVSACAKHFPGKGHAPVDAHLGLPIIPSTWQEMAAVHLPPFVAAIRAGVDLIMSSHPCYPHLDPEPGQLATFSRRLIHDCLRRELGFQGVISSDDLEMGAIAAVCPIGLAGVQATRAGHDLLLICHTLSAQREVQQALLAAYEQQELSRTELEASVARLASLRAKRESRCAPGEPVPEAAGPVLAATISRQAVRVLQDHATLLPLVNRRQSLGVIFPRFAQLADRIMIEPEMLAGQDFLQTEFAQAGLAPEVLLVSMEPTADDRQAAAQLAGRVELIILFLYDAHLFPSNKALLDRVQATAHRLIVVLLRDPYDVAFLRPETTCLTAFGWRVCQLQAMLTAMCHGVGLKTC
ncbi:MAG: beta-N-acetylhexosaminidase [Desulfobacca sp.]|uniref:beta-N-acetylhexosaminidase n=1 Tax=Desulfobacca sp. TaxID=2067990 RepID=UPI00404B50BB